MGQGRQVEARPWRPGQTHLFTQWPRIPDQLMKSVLQCLCCVHFHSAKLLNAYCFLPSQLACLSPDPLQVAGLGSSWVISLLFSDSRPPALGFALLPLQLRFHTHCLSPPCKELWLPYPQDHLAFAWASLASGCSPHSVCTCLGGAQSDDATEPALSTLTPWPQALPNWPVLKKPHCWKTLSQYILLNVVRELCTSLPRWDEPGIPLSPAVWLLVWRFLWFDSVVILVPSWAEGSSYFCLSFSLRIALSVKCLLDEWVSITNTDV